MGTTSSHLLVVLVAVGQTTVAFRGAVIPARRRPTSAPTAAVAVRHLSPFAFEELARRSSEETEMMEMVSTLRRLFGTSRSIWGDLDAKEARLLYRHLLPRALGDSRPSTFSQLKTRALSAAAARRAAKLYVRERSILPVRLLAGAVDNVRHGSAEGASVDDLLAKYVDEARARLDADRDDDAVECLAYALLLKKSCETNRVIDSILLDEDDLADDDLFADEWNDDRERAWTAFLLAKAVVDDRPHTAARLAPAVRTKWLVVRAKWLSRRLGRRLRGRPADPPPDQH